MSYEDYNKKITDISNVIKSEERLLTTNRKGHNHRDLNFKNKQIIVRVPWRSNKMNVLIPMAGAGSRFAEAGYTFPKPLIEVGNKPMIQVVTDNLNIEALYM